MSTVKAIYAGTAALGLREDDERRDFFERVTGKRWLGEMTPGEKEAVVAELRAQGFRAKSPRARLDGPYAPKLQALWISAWNLGLVRSRDDAALLTFVKRQTGIDHLRFLREAEPASRVIEALKAWIARDGGVIWDPKPCPGWLRPPLAKISLAQFFLLFPDPEGAPLDGFRAVIQQVVVLKGDLEVLGAMEWRLVTNHLGALIRARKGAR